MVREMFIARRSIPMDGRSIPSMVLNRQGWWRTGGVMGVAAGATAHCRLPHGTAALRPPVVPRASLPRTRRITPPHGTRRLAMVMQRTTMTMTTTSLRIRPTSTLAVARVIRLQRNLIQTRAPTGTRLRRLNSVHIRTTNTPRMVTPRASRTRAGASESEHRS